MALSTYDSQLLSSQQQAQIAQAQKNYADAAARGDKQGMESAHNFAESIRAQAGYSGMGDGAGYVALPKQNTFDMGSVSTVDTSKLDDWKSAYIQQQQAALEKAYNDALQQLDVTYNKNKAEYEGSKEDAELAFKKNMGALYDNAYKNNILAQQQASARGLTSSAQGLAMTTSQLANASNQAASLVNDRDTTLAKIDLQLNRLSEDYNISKDTLKKNLDLDKIEALSTGDLQYISSLLDIEQFNATARNDFLMNSINNSFSASEAQKDRDAQKELLLLELAAQQNNGGGYYGGNYYKSSGSGGAPVTEDIAAAYEYVEPQLTSKEKDLFMQMYNEGKVKTGEQVIGLSSFIKTLASKDKRDFADNIKKNPAFANMVNVLVNKNKNSAIDPLNNPIYPIGSNY